MVYKGPPLELGSSLVDLISFGCQGTWNFKVPTRTRGPVEGGVRGDKYQDIGKVTVPLTLAETEKKKKTGGVNA